MQDRELEQLLCMAQEAHDFDAWVKKPALAKQLSRPAASMWWGLGGITGVAAALALGAILLRPGVHLPVRTSEVAVADKLTPQVTPELPRGHIVDVGSVSRLDPALDPDLASMSGVASLTAERSLVIAYSESADGCGCVSWRVVDARETIDAELVQRLLKDSACATPAKDSSSLRVFAVTGRRVDLPFEDSEAERLARCLAPVCDPTPSGSEWCMDALSEVCVNPGLTVQALTLGAMVR
jgi:hypothetical protein